MKMMMLSVPAQMPCLKPVLITFLILLLIAVSTATKLAVASKWRDVDELIEALLGESLRSNLLQACDGERVALHCPRNTEIHVQNVFYGRLVPSVDLCPSSAQTPVSTANFTKTSPMETPEDTACDFVDAEKRIVELCKGRRKCRVDVRPEFFGDRDSCPGTSKYLQASYSCKPTSFEDQSFCEGSTTQLSCRVGKRLAVHSARYGRSASGQTLQCATADKLHASVEEDCIGNVHPQVLAQCHAQRECSIPVNDQFLGDPCSRSPPNAPSKQLSLIYVCVNEEVFSDAAIQGELESSKDLQKLLEELTIQRHNEFIERQRQQLNDRQNEKNSFVRIAQHQPPTNDDEFARENNHYDGRAFSGDDEIGRGVKGKESATDSKTDQTETSQETEEIPGSQNITEKIRTFLEQLSTGIIENKERSVLYLLIGMASLAIFVLLGFILWQCVEQRRAFPRSVRYAQTTLDSNQYRRHHQALLCLGQQTTTTSTKAGEFTSLLVGPAGRDSGSSGTAGSGTSSTNTTSPMYLDSSGDSSHLGDTPAASDFYRYQGSQTPGQLPLKQRNGNSNASSAVSYRDSNTMTCHGTPSLNYCSPASLFGGGFWGAAGNLFPHDPPLSAVPTPPPGLLGRTSRLALNSQVQFGQPHFNYAGGFPPSTGTLRRAPSSRSGVLLQQHLQLPPNVRFQPRQTPSTPPNRVPSSLHFYS